MLGNRGLMYVSMAADMPMGGRHENLQTHSPPRCSHDTPHELLLRGSSLHTAKRHVRNFEEKPLELFQWTSKPHRTGRSWYEVFPPRFRMN